MAGIARDHDHHSCVNFGRLSGNFYRPSAEGWSRKGRWVQCMQGYQGEFHASFVAPASRLVG